MDGVAFAGYQGGAELDAVVRLIEQDLSEPYSIFTYHYFLLEHQHLCRTVRHRTARHPHRTQGLVRRRARRRRHRQDRAAPREPARVHWHARRRERVQGTRDR